jgi:predicted aconitase
LHLAENRHATVLVDLKALTPALRDEAAFYPVLGAWLGATLGDRIAAIDGLPAGVDEDRLKALGAAAAATGEVGLFHVIGRTPEAPDRATAFAGLPPALELRPSGADFAAAADRLSTVTADAQSPVDAIAVGSPHFSAAEFAQLLKRFAGRRATLPFYACTGRHVVAELARDGLVAAIEAAGVRLVVDTCVVVAPDPARIGGCPIADQFRQIRAIRAGQYRL